MTESLNKKLIRNYQKRKNWYGRNKYENDVEIYEIETGRAGVRTGDSLLEIGFGEGHFLEWAREKEFDVDGVEINADFYELAKERGHTVYLGEATKVLPVTGKKYDGIFLFDVLEHLTLEEISNLFDFLQTVLKKTGWILLRSPNGGSPFGRLFQHSDATHVTSITGPKVQDLAMLSGLEVKAVYNGARTIKTGAHKNRFLKWFAYKLRDAIQLVIGYLYYGENVPLDPNLTIVLGHSFKGSSKK